MARLHKGGAGRPAMSAGSCTCRWLYLGPLDTIHAMGMIEPGEAMRQWKERSAASSFEVESEGAVEANATARHR